MGQPVCWRFGRMERKNSGLVNFVAESPRLPFVQFISIYWKTAANAWKWHQRWLEEMKHKFPVWTIPSQNKNRTTFSRLTQWKIFHWNDPKSRLPFTFKTDFLETFCKCYGNNYFLIITGRSAFQSFDAMSAVEMYRYFESYFKKCIIFKFRFVFFIFCPRRCFTVFTLWFYLFLNLREKLSNA